LALLDEPRLFQALNLKRALLTAEIPVEGLEKPLAVAVTHLSAFSFGDGTHPKQVEALAAWMASHPPDQPWILAGDMNLLPPGDDRNRLTTERELYADEPNPINQLIPRFTEVFSDQLSPANRTYLPFGAAEPDRKIDYIFYGGPLEIRSAQVLREHSAISDHLPIRLEMVIPLPPEPAPPAVPEETPAIQ
jgi:endonuclease/exonuclease/phosphatase family metal-dependent hydrolase